MDKPVPGDQPITSFADTLKLKPELRPHLMYLGTALGSLHDGELSRETIQFCVDKILDKIEQVKANPDRLARFKAGLAAVTE